MKREDSPIKKYTVNLFLGDLETLQELFPRAGASRVIRNLVRKFINDCRTRAEQKAEPVDFPDDIFDE